MKKPNFIIAGFPKCGTTSLHHYLSEHPQIFMPSQKELHFFTYEILSKLKNGPKDGAVKKTQIQDSKKYLDFYRNVKNEIAVGDASPSYINYPNQFLKIKEYLEDPKFIIVLRDPINRAYSNYLHLKREQRETLTFKEAVNRENKRIKDKYSDFWYYKFNSTYYDKILKAKETFKEVLIITSEELNENHVATMKKVYKFLGVDCNFITKRKSNRFNKGGYYKKNLFTKIIFQPSKFKNLIKKVIKPTPSLKILLARVASLFRAKTEEIDEETVLYLTKHFREDVKKLKSLNINTSNWRDY